MPLQVELLWEEVDKKNFDGALKRLTDQKNLINEIDKDGTCLIMRLFLEPVTTRPNALIGYLLAQEKLKVDYKDPALNKLVIDPVLTSGNLEFLTILLKNPVAIKNEHSFAYAEACHYLNQTTKALTLAQKTPNSPKIAALTTKLETCRKMLEMTREATIRLAITKKDSTLLDDLVAAGANPEACFADGTDPKALAAKIPNLSAWYKANDDKKLSKMDPKMLALKAMEAQMATMQMQHLTDKSKVLQQATEQRTGFLQRVLGF
ncbi:MAG: hypothetical protein EPN84_08935 [Legionella sp.]|nr:MAG: hypothetical protein EPN84_08935 [Legionella sp.]